MTTAASNMEAEFEKACKQERVAGMVCLAANGSGTFKYQKSFGVRTLDPAVGAPEARPSLTSDTPMRLASASKLITSVAAMQCVERGLIGLDDDVRQFDPDLKDIQLLTGFDENDKPILVAPKEKLTLRRLLSHSSGFTYDVLSPLLLKWREIQGVKPSPEGPKLTDRFLQPLTSEPGTEWVYSPSIDWAGRVVERVSGQSLEDFMQKNIVQPLKLEKFSFFPWNHPELLQGRADMTARDEESGKVVHAPEDYWMGGRDDALGGMGIYTTPEDYFVILHSLLKDDERLLSSKTLKEMLSPQLTPAAKANLKKFLSNPQFEALGLGGCYPIGSERDHSLAGMYLVEDVPAEKSPRRSGTSAWMGFPNFHWFLDPQADICGVFATQLVPPQDVTVRELCGSFEKAMYEKRREVDK